jgi:hypothetical protein
VPRSQAFKTPVTKAIWRILVVDCADLPKPLYSIFWGWMPNSDLNAELGPELWLGGR